MSKDDAKRVFMFTWFNIKNANTDELYRQQGKAWHNLCDDICLYYASRFVLFNKPMPMVDPSDFI